MAKKRNRREAEEFSMSFLDVICCGFGAIILLLMITKTVQPQIIEASTVKNDCFPSRQSPSDANFNFIDIRREGRI